jgi:hypothetical protein
LERGDDREGIILEMKRNEEKKRLTRGTRGGGFRRRSTKRGG